MTREYVAHIVDDDETVRASLVYLISAAGVPARSHASATEFLAIAGDLENGCLITDLRMPDMSGLELLKRLRAAGHTIPIIFVTGHGDIQAAVEAMRAGAVDFLEKPFSAEAILTSIALARDAHRQLLDDEQKKTQAQRLIEVLSARERQVLSGVLSGMPNKIIAHNLGLSPRTVEVYRASLMAKAQAKNLAQLVRMAHGIELTAQQLDIAEDGHAQEGS
jgi:two-component system, LuxR family, response regulator FixJ